MSNDIQKAPIKLINPILSAPEEPIDQASPFLPMVHGKATDAIAQMTSKGKKVNPLTGSLTIEEREVKLVLQKFNDIAVTLGIKVHKLLSVGIAEFTASNNIGGKEDQALTYGVCIDLNEYAKKCGYNVTPHIQAGASPEAIAVEEKRANNALKEARKKIKEDLQALSSSRISWNESLKGKKSGDYVDIAIIGSHSIRKGFIYMVFDPVFAHYLTRLQITQYPQALLAIDPRKSNAYNIGYAMSLHYNMDSNQKIGTAQLLRVSKLLEYTDLPTIATIRKQRTSWEARIKEPFETSLDALTECGLLEDWRYSHSKGVELTDEEADFSNYEEWASTLVHFTLRNAPNHAPRLAARAEEKKARQTKAKTKRTPKKKKPEDK